MQTGDVLWEKEQKGTVRREGKRQQKKDGGALRAGEHINKETGDSDML